MPECVGSLARLQSLTLSHNNITVLPIGLGRLTALQCLDVRGNQLDVLPAELGQLTSLCELDASENSLAAVPASLGHLTSLRTLLLDKNRCRLPATYFMTFKTVTALLQLIAICMFMKGCEALWLAKVFGGKHCVVRATPSGAPQAHELPAQVAQRPSRDSQGVPLPGQAEPARESADARAAALLGRLPGLQRAALRQH